MSMQKRVLGAFLMGAVMTPLFLGGCQSTPPKAEQTSEQPVSLLPAWLENPVTTDTQAVGIADLDPSNQADSIKRAKQQAIKQLDTRYQKAFVKLYSQIFSENQKGLAPLSFLERKTLNEVKKHLPAVPGPEYEVVDFYADTKAQKMAVLVKRKAVSVENIKQHFAQRDADLWHYLHVSEKGSRLKQLIALMPVVKDLLQMARLQAAYQVMTGEPLQYKDPHLVSIYKQQITKLFDNFSVSFEALDAGSVNYDESLFSALQKNGLNVSSMMPDLTIRYYLEKEAMPAKKGGVKVSVTGDYEMVNELGKRFAVLNLTTTGEGKKEAEAVQQAIEKQGAPIVNQIVKQLAVAKQL